MRGFGVGRKEASLLTLFVSSCLYYKSGVSNCKVVGDHGPHRLHSVYVHVGGHSHPAVLCMQAETSHPTAPRTYTCGYCPAYSSSPPCRPPCGTMLHRLLRLPAWRPLGSNTWHVRLCCTTLCSPSPWGRGYAAEAGGGRESTQTLVTAAEIGRVLASWEFRGCMLTTCGLHAAHGTPIVLSCYKCSIPLQILQ